MPPTPQPKLAPATGLTGRIVYASVPSNIFVINADGSGERQLTPARGAPTATGLGLP
jgi:hypothetical protein